MGNGCNGFGQSIFEFISAHLYLLHCYNISIDDVTKITFVSMSKIFPIEFCGPSVWIMGVTNSDK